MGVLRAIYKHRTSYLFLLPAMIPFLFFVLIPFLGAIVLVFRKGGLFSPWQFAGLANFKLVLRDTAFRRTIVNTVYYVVGILSLAIGLGLFLAVLVSQDIRGMNTLRLVIFFPNLVSMVVAGYVWLFILHKDGPINVVLSWLSLKSLNLLGNPRTAIWGIILAELWHGVGFYMLLFLGGLQGIPRELREAAFIDGCGRLQAFWHVTVPLLRPTFVFAAIMGTIWNLQVFEPVWVMTKGGPASSTSTITWYIYSTAFFYDRVGSASVMGIVLLIMTVLAVMLQAKILGFGTE